MSLALQGGFLPLDHQGSPSSFLITKNSQNISADLEEQLSEMPKPKLAIAKFGFLSLLIDEIGHVQGCMAIDCSPYRD